MKKAEELDPVAEANRRALGKRPAFLDDPATERVLAIAMAIAGELSVARERIDTLERLLERHGVLKREEIERYEPDTTAQAERNALGREYVARILRIVEQDVQALRGQAGPSMDEAMAELGRRDEPSKP
jgi:hypothetical protein